MGKCGRAVVGKRSSCGEVWESSCGEEELLWGSVGEPTGWGRGALVGKCGRALVGKRSSCGEVWESQRDGEEELLWGSVGEPNGTNFSLVASAKMSHKQVSDFVGLYFIRWTVPVPAPK